MTWRERSKESIREAVLAFCDASGHDPRTLHSSCTDAEKHQLLKMVSHWYPFGQRTMFPYKAWCAEVKILKAWLFRVDEPLGGLFGSDVAPEASPAVE